MLNIIAINHRQNLLSGFFGWLCNKVSLADCCPYQVVILSTGPDTDLATMDAGPQSSRGEPSTANDIAEPVNEHIEHVQVWMEVRDGESRGHYRNLMNDIRARDAAEH